MSQLHLLGGGYRAEFSRRGAAVRALRHGDRDLVTGWPDGGPVPFFAGTILAPWPNRVGGASYDFQGVTHRLPVTEPRRGHALHGLVATADWQVTEWLAAEDDHGFVRLTHTISPSPGYPFTLRLRVLHTLDARGLTTTLTAENLGEEAAPYGCGPHPWLLAGEEVAAYELSLPASRVLLTDEALLPRSLEDVAGTPYDFRRPRELGGTGLDHAFTGLSAGVVEVRGAEGGVRLSWDPALMPWVQVCTSTALGYRGLAVEPMTCPPDAFNSGTDLVVLRPGDKHETSWTISAL